MLLYIFTSILSSEKGKNIILVFFNILMFYALLLMYSFIDL